MMMMTSTNDMFFVVVLFAIRIFHFIYPNVPMPELFGIITTENDENNRNAK